MEAIEYVSKKMEIEHVEYESYLNYKEGLGRGLYIKFKLLEDWPLDIKLWLRGYQVNRPYESPVIKLQMIPHTEELYDRLHTYFEEYETNLSRS